MCISGSAPFLECFSGAEPFLPNLPAFVASRADAWPLEGLTSPRCLIGCTCQNVCTVVQATLATLAEERRSKLQAAAARMHARGASWRSASGRPRSRSVKFAEPSVSTGGCTGNKQSAQHAPEAHRSAGMSWKASWSRFSGLLSVEF